MIQRLFIISFVSIINKRIELYTIVKNFSFTFLMTFKMISDKICSFMNTIFSVKLYPIELLVLPMCFRSKTATGISSSFRVKSLQLWLTLISSCSASHGEQIFTFLKIKNHFSCSFPASSIFCADSSAKSKSLISNSILQTTNKISCWKKRKNQKP